MRNKINCSVTLLVIFCITVFYAPHVTAFFDYNKFHPLPFRPDLQEHCPQVSAANKQPAIQITLCIHFSWYVFMHKWNKNRWKKNAREIHIQYKLNIMNWTENESKMCAHFIFLFRFSSLLPLILWTLPFCWNWFWLHFLFLWLLLCDSLGESDAKFWYQRNDGILVCCWVLCIVWGGRRIFLHEM